MEADAGYRDRRTVIEGIKAIIWDWNGTLLDDVDVCIRSMNEMLVKRSMRTLTREFYREVFTFPVIDYYKRIGWNLDTESWDALAFEFIDIYLNNMNHAPLHPEAPVILEYMARRKYRQYILSAMEQQALTDSISQKGIMEYFERVAGLGNHYAYSKSDIALALMEKMHNEKEHVCLIGDTLHDLEVSRHVGCHCILVANGHQAFERLTRQHSVVIHHLEQLRNIL